MAKQDTTAFFMRWLEKSGVRNHVIVMKNLAAGRHPLRMVIPVSLQTHPFLLMLLSFVLQLP